ncbi:hypothetical protein [Azotobacter salinestris]|uniref:hypothetical protein n=1 Tax=Azotobacter salinestris TaxID=69964 RepID=UPI001266B1A4|nr:hypothetical protein [Azotobacter salinestris]
MAAINLLYLHFVRGFHACRAGSMGRVDGRSHPPSFGFAIAIGLLLLGQRLNRRECACMTEGNKLPVSHEQDVKIGI